MAFLSLTTRLSWLQFKYSHVQDVLTSLLLGSVVVEMQQISYYTGPCDYMTDIHVALVPMQ